MGVDTQNNHGSQEIDLSYLSKKTANFFDNIGYSLYRFFKFLIKNIIFLAIVLVVGAVAGFFLDKQRGEIYKQQVIVVPNFNSTSYLYNKIENAEFEDEPITKVEIEPIVDVYQFINESYNNLEIAKYLSENNLQLTKYEVDSDVEKFYKYHLMTIYTRGKDKDRNFVNSYLHSLNNNDYFTQLQKIEQVNLERNIHETDSTINEVNKIFQKLGSKSVQTTDLNIEMYSELNDLINGKKSLIRDLGKLKTQKLEQTEVIYAASVLPNIKANNIPMVILLPLVLFILFIIGAWMIRLAKKYKAREKRISE